MTTELEKRPWHYARDYLNADKYRLKAMEAGIPKAAEKHKATMQNVWNSIPAHLLDMVKDHISSHREKERHGKG
jgi:hypothetical protein